MIYTVLCSCIQHTNIYHVPYQQLFSSQKANITLIWNWEFIAFINKFFPTIMLTFLASCAYNILQHNTQNKLIAFILRTKCTDSTQHTIENSSTHIQITPQHNTPSKYRHLTPTNDTTVEFQWKVHTWAYCCTWCPPLPGCCAACRMACACWCMPCCL